MVGVHELDMRRDSAPPDKPIRQIVTVGFSPLLIKEEGVHRFVLVIDGKELGEVLLTVDGSKSNGHRQPDKKQG
jgi:hypothetical protein